MGHRPLKRDEGVNAQADDLRRRVENLERRYEALGRFVGLIFPSTEPVVTEDDAAGWFLVIPEDLGGLRLTHAHAAVYTPGGDVVVQIRNVTTATDMLTDPITIDSGDNTSYTSGSPPVIDTAADEVSTGDLIVADVDDDGGASGLDVILMFA